MDVESHGPAALVGQQLAGYQLERLLGTGAVGAVYLGQRLEATPRVLERAGELPIMLPDQAAVKVLIPPWRFTDEERAAFHARFKREAQTLERLHHPHILTLLDSGEERERDLTYLLLPYLSGGTLANWLRTRAGRADPLPYAGIIEMLRQVAEALDYAHTQGIVHRDVKPANILRDEAGRLYLADFGIVRLLSDTQTHLTASGFVVGTPDYMAPEQLDGLTVGPTADIYSLGMVLYELVTGKVAFQANTLTELVRRQLFESPPAPSTLRTDLPAPAEAAILRALAKHPEQRFPTAMELTQAFTLGLRDQWTPGLTLFAGPRFTAPPIAQAAPPSTPMYSSLPPVTPAGGLFRPTQPITTPLNADASIAPVAPELFSPPGSSERAADANLVGSRFSYGVLPIPGTAGTQPPSAQRSRHFPDASPTPLPRTTRQMLGLPIPLPKRIFLGGMAVLVVLGALAGALAFLRPGGHPTVGPTTAGPNTVHGTMGSVRSFKPIGISSLPQIGLSTPQAETSVPIQFRWSANQSAAISATARQITGLPPVASNSGITLTPLSSSAPARAVTALGHQAELGQSQLGVSSPAGVSIGTNGSALVEVVGGAIQLNSRNRQAQVSLASLFQGPYHTGAGFGESRVLLDSESGAWVVITNEIVGSANNVTHSYFDLAISGAADPFAGWYIYQIDTQLAAYSGCTWADYPQLGLDDYGIFISATSFDCGQSGKLRGADLWLLPWKAYEHGQAVAIAEWTGFKNAHGDAVVTITPAVEAKNDETELLVSNDSGYVDGGKTSQQLTVWAVWPSGSNTRLAGVPSISSQTISLSSPYADPPDVGQPGTSARIPGGDARVTGAILSRGHLFAAFTTALNWTGDTETRSGVYWVNLAVTAGAVAGVPLGYKLSAQVLAQERIGQSGLYVFAPSFSISPQGNALLAAEAAGPALYPSSLYMTPSSSAVSSGTILVRGKRALMDASWTYLTGTSQVIQTAAWVPWAGFTLPSDKGNAWQTDLWVFKGS